MAFIRVTAFVLAVAVLAPSTVFAADHLVARDEPVGGAGAPAHASAARRAPLEFDLVGLHWKGPGSVWFRTESSAGVWSRWRPAAAEVEDLPDSSSPERDSGRGWKLGSPYWTGPADAIQYRFEGDVRKLRAYFVWSGPAAATTAPRVSAPALSRAARPAIIRRAQWGADEAIVRAPPYYASEVDFAVVHHTAGSNSYSASQSAAIVRGIERYHVLANGWNDIGYNFLVDKYGQIFEGRGGGVSKNVVGAHAEGFNTGSTGVAVLGSYETQRISAKARAALVRLLAWRLDVAHADPSSRLTWVSGGNPKYPAGTKVSLRAISGHRDTGPTSCPGGRLYAQLPGIAADVAALGLPKLYDPEVGGSLGGPVRFTARLSSSLPWQVTIEDSSGAQVASGDGVGQLVDWTWDASATPFGSFTYAITAGSDVRPASGIVPGPPPLAITTLAVHPRVVTPNGDGASETTSVSYALSARATVKIEVLDSSAKVVRSLVTGQAYRSGTRSVVWDGRSSSGALPADGSYRVRLTATSPGQQKVGSRRIVLDRTLGFVAVAPTAISPNGDGRADASQIVFRLARQADVRVEILRDGTSVAVPQATASMAKGRASVPWDGRTKAGKVASDGAYTARVQATTALGTRTRSLPLTVDTRAPVVKIAAARRRDGKTHLRVWLSERATLRVRYGAPHWWNGGLREVKRGPGYSGLSLPLAASVRVRAHDVALNLSVPVVARVRR